MSRRFLILSLELAWSIELPFHELKTSGPGAGSVNDLFNELAAQVRRHAHPVGLWHVPSFENIPVPRVSPGKLFFGSSIDQAGYVDTDVNDGLRFSGSGMELDGIFDMSPSASCMNAENDVLDGVFVVGSSSSCIDPVCSSSQKMLTGTVLCQPWERFYDCCSLFFRYHFV